VRIDPSCPNSLIHTMLSRPRALPAGFIAPCLPTNAPQPPSGEAWLHEIKHDGFRVIARKDGERVKLYSRPGNDLTDRFPLIVEAAAKLRSRSCIIDGEAVACGDDGIASFDRIRYRRHDVFGLPHERCLRHSPRPTPSPDLLFRAKGRAANPLSVRAARQCKRVGDIAGSGCALAHQIWP
jgi:hypothetical protein